MKKNDLPSSLKINHSRTKLEWKIQNSDQYSEKRKQKAMFYCTIHALCTRKQLTVNTGFQGQEEAETNPLFKERSPKEPAGSKFSASGKCHSPGWGSTQPAFYYCLGTRHSKSCSVSFQLSDWLTVACPRHHPLPCLAVMLGKISWYELGERK